MKNATKILSAVLILLLLFNVYQLIKCSTSPYDQNSIDQNYKVEIGRISGGIEDVNDIDYTGYLLAIEHASKASALSQLTSYHKKSPDTTSRVSEINVMLRDLHNNKKAPKNKEELLNLIQKFSSDPTDQKILNEIFVLLQESLNS
ncbi:hypothetical protein [Paenibacillus sp. J2TS4]|uniref:hypothetical protein n=1 Tax=Paenibacillus sp. J2TS4 TaxID=2807194 RepID=UPI001B07752D|nr:hypothetical protein [Paenibacillus sp. J2TS4]GIP36461.1 hypothetical protein J2TS4_56710 [Paenibacillus sp. J2TS4]